MRIGEIKKTALQALKGNWKLVVLLSFIVFLVGLVPSLPELFFGDSATITTEPEPTSATSIILTFIFSIAIFPFTVAVNWFYLSLSRGNKESIAQVFSIYKDGKLAFKLIGATILQAIYLFLWFLLFIIPGYIKSISYSQMFFILRDHPEYTVNQAITESRKMMNGYKWKYFLLILSFIGWGFLCIFTLGIGLLWLVPYITTSSAAFYNELIDYKNNDEITQEVLV